MAGERAAAKVTAYLGWGLASLGENLTKLKNTATDVMKEEAHMRNNETSSDGECSSAVESNCPDDELDPPFAAGVFGLPC